MLEEATNPLALWLSARELASFEPGLEVVIRQWATRIHSENDTLLTELFAQLLKESAELEGNEKLIAYDARSVPTAALSSAFRKRLDGRRKTKPTSGKPQWLVKTPFDPSAFNFQRVHAREKLLKLQVSTGRYYLLPNRYPLFACHLLLVAEELQPQQMNPAHISAVVELVSGCSFCAYFNSWTGGASVNHFHCHIIGEQPPIAARPLVDGPMMSDAKRCLIPEGFPGLCYVFEHSKANTVHAAVSAMQEEDTAHNLLFTATHVYIFPRPAAEAGAPAIRRAREIYPENMGGPELIGSFTLYDDELYTSFTEEHASEAVRLSTAPLPSSVLQPAGPASAVDQANEARAAAAHAQRELREERQRADALEADRDRLAAENAALVAEVDRLRKMVDWVRDDGVGVT